ncbi:MAG TPA: YfcE family phosphodiesterase [Acidimicrobiales bacterium]|nr:YfcE family phosphodiesterase [Acidimicrobiales bacterium]
MNELEGVLSGLPRPDFAASLGAALHRDAARLAPTAAAAGMTIGVIADTHCARAEDLPQSALDALARADLIVHCGDIGAPGVLDRLEAIAPVLAIRSANDPEPDGRRLFDGPRLIRMGSLLVGVVSHVEDASRDFDEIFGTSVDVVLTGTTHRAEVLSVEQSDGLIVTMLNPGSPTFPASGPPTVAFIGTVAGEAVPIVVSLDSRKESE